MGVEDGTEKSLDIEARENEYKRINNLTTRLTVARDERDDLQSRHEVEIRLSQSIGAERDAAREERDTVIVERDGAREYRDKVIADRAVVLDRLAKTETERDDARACSMDISDELDEAREKLKVACAERKAARRGWGESIHACIKAKEERDEARRLREPTVACQYPASDCAETRAERDSLRARLEGNEGEMKDLGDRRTEALARCADLGVERDRAYAARDEWGRTTKRLRETLDALVTTNNLRLSAEEMTSVALDRISSILDAV